MQVKIPPRDNPNLKKYSKHHYDLAKQFADALKKEMHSYVKAIVLFGSAARKTTNPHSDVDVMVLVDDLSLIMTRDVADAYRMVIQRIVTHVSKKIHVVTLRVTSFWEYMRKGDPIGINILRDGVSLYDTGFFEPLQQLLRKGKIRPTNESIWSYYLKAPATLNNARWHVLQGTVDLYWAVIDSAHAALMSIDAIPPTPEHVGDMLDDLMVKKGLLEKKYSDIMRNAYKTAKKIMHREITELSGQEFDRYHRDATAFVDRMKIFVDKKDLK